MSQGFSGAVSQQFCSMPPGMAVVMSMVEVLQQQRAVPRQGMLKAKTAWLVMVTTRRMTSRMDRGLRFFTVSRIP